MKAYDGRHYAVIKVDPQVLGSGIYQTVFDPQVRRRSLEERIPVARGPNAYAVTFKFRAPVLSVPDGKSCRVSVSYDDESPADDAIQYVTSASSEWTAYSAKIESEETIFSLVIGLDCPDGNSATLHVDDVNFVVAGYPFVSTDVARDGSFEDSPSSAWSYSGSALRFHDNAVDAYEGNAYVQLGEGVGSVSQTLVMPTGTTETGFHSYDIKFVRKVNAYDPGSAPTGTAACKLSVTFNDNQLAVGDGSGDITAVDGAVGLIFTATDDADYVKTISINLSCNPTDNGSAEVLIDYVRIKSRKYTPPTTTPDPDCPSGRRDGLNARC